jgi:hypothetical protein
MFNGKRLLVTAGILLTLLLSGQSVTTTASAAVRSGAAAPTKTTRIGIAYGDTLVWMNDADLNAALDDAVAVHAHWVRADLSWADVQPNSSTEYLWSGFDRVVAAANARGLNVLPVISYTPAWARDPGCNSFACPPANSAAFAQFASLAAKRYSAMGVHAWEVWNEENIPIFWPNPDAQRYATLLRATTTAIRKRDPGATVLMGGMAATDTNNGWIDPRTFLDDVCTYGACKGLTGIAYHPYTFPFLPSDPVSLTSSWNRIENTPVSLRSVLNSHGFPSMKIWLTEDGAPTGGPGTAYDGTVTATTDHVTEARQAEIAQNAVVTAAASPNVVGLFWYTDKDDPNYTSNVRYFGLRRDDGSQKPAFQAFADAASVVPQP